MNELEKLGKIITTDVLIIGGGLAGLITALKIKKLNSDIDVMCVEKGYHGYNGESTKAGHGFFYMSPEDDIDAFCKEQVEENLYGQYLNDQEYMYETVAEAYDYVKELEELGAVFAHDPDGSLHYHREFATKKCSAVNVDLDFVVPFGEQAVANGVRIAERVYFTDILTKDGKAVGAVGFHMDTTEFYIFKAKAVVLASCDFNPSVRSMFYSPATALIAAYEAGAQFRNVEHATYFDLCYRNTGNIMYGVHWVVCNKKGENIFQKYHCTDYEDIEIKFMRALLKETEEGNYPFYVDFSQLPDTSETEGEGFNMGMVMPTRIQMDQFIHQEEEGNHLYNPEISLITYILSRCLRTDGDAKTAVPNLWAVGMMTMCGTAHGSWVHGDGLGQAARTALRAAKSIVNEMDDKNFCEIDKEQVQKFKERIYAPYHYQGKELPYKVIHYLYDMICMPKYSVWKTEETMQEMLECLKDMRNQLETTIYVPEGDGHHLSKAVEARTMIDMLEIMYMVYNTRKESRGYHMRGDYTERDDKNWLKWIVVNKGDDGRPHLDFERIPFERYKWKPACWEKKDRD